MKHISSFCLILILCADIPAQNSLNTYSITDTFAVNIANRYKLSSIAIIPMTEKIVLDGRLLQREQYRISYADSEFSLADTVRYSLYDTIYITYSAVLTFLQKEYKRRELVYRYDETAQDTIRGFAQSGGSLTAEAIFGKGIQRSGSISRGFTIGSTRDFTLSSGLRLQLSGHLTDDIEIVAALNDENTPIQPEGNTETLEEIDKVFIEIRHKNATGIFGDYDLNINSGEFGKLSRKLEGVKADARFNNYNGSAALASARGKYAANQFAGAEGVQGPYRLTGSDGERDIIIIAGSEKVYIDGQEMKRGEGNDYVIDYANSEITFTPSRLITSASRITVDFEYTDRRYTRSLFSTSQSVSLFDRKLKVGVNYFREGDDPDSPIDISFTDRDKELISGAGDNVNLAVKSGAQIAQPDSLGIVKGAYIKKDTVINGRPYELYIYNPSSAEAIYDVTFSYVGSGKGDYNRERIGAFSFAGIGAGSYMPLIYLPLPELKNVGNVIAEFSLIKDLSISLEAAGSAYDRNRLSNINDIDNEGFAGAFTLKYNKEKFNLGGVNLNRLQFYYKERFIEQEFNPADRINSIEFNRDYNYNALISGTESLRETGIEVEPIKEIDIAANYGRLSKGEFYSNRFFNKAVYSGPDAAVEYNLDYVSSGQGLFKSDWLRQSGDFSYTYKIFRPGFRFQNEDKKDKNTGIDSLHAGSLYYYEVNPYIGLLNLGGFRLNAGYAYREDSFPLNGVLEKESHSKTQNYELIYTGTREISSSFNLTFRDKKYTEKYAALGYADNKSMLAQSQTRFNFWDRTIEGNLYYEASSQRSSLYEKVFIQTAKGTGSYIYLGDLNENGVQDENEFEQASYDADYILTSIPSDEMFPVTDVKANARFKINYQNIFVEDSFIDKLLNPISTETTFRAEENSTDAKSSNIYLLKFSHFLNDSTTIRGANIFQQDVYLFENKPDFSLRLRYYQTRNLNQYSGGLEKIYYKERSARIKFQLIEEIGNQTDITNIIDNATAPSLTNRSRNLTKNTVRTDFSYRPFKYIETGFAIEAGSITDDFPFMPTEIDLNSQLVRLVFSIAAKGRLRAEFERSELSSSVSENYIPYEALQGNVIGKNWIWRLNFDYRISDNLQFTVNYDGRVIGAGSAVHTAQAEAKAYF